MRLGLQSCKNSDGVPSTLGFFSVFFFVFYFWVATVGTTHSHNTECQWLCFVRMEIEKAAIGNAGGVLTFNSLGVRRQPINLIHFISISILRNSSMSGTNVSMKTVEIGFHSFNKIVDDDNFPQMSLVAPDPCFWICRTFRAYCVL